MKLPIFLTSYLLSIDVKTGFRIQLKNQLFVSKHNTCSTTRQNETFNIIVYTKCRNMTLKKIY